MNVNNSTSTRSLIPLVAVLALSAIVSCGRPPGTPPPPVPSRIVGHCEYRNSFSGMMECRDYLGDGWTDAAVTADCQRRNTTAVLGSGCSYPSTLGQCILNADRPNVTRLTFPGSDASQCGAVQNGCEFWGGGFFVGSMLCGATPPVTNMPPASLPVFRQPDRVCRAPLAGEPAGRGPNGQVCTWNSVAGATEEGRRFEDYGNCEIVRTQRPYWPARPAPARTMPDPRMSDPAYVAELNWVKSQITSSACVCCHAAHLTPQGASNWDIDVPGNFMDTFHDTGLALGAEWIDSTSLGAYDAADNNGFGRVGIPTTDRERMARFFRNELANRGRTQESFAGAVPFGGPIYTQMTFTPSACTGTDGVSRDGTISWSGGGARYVYVLEAGSANPGVPPNLDTPRGTLWRIDVPFTGSPINSGIRYGVVPPGTSQLVPAMNAAPPALQSGRQYYLYVLQDVAIPITRCTFTAP